MRPRPTTFLLALAGLLVAVAVGLAANAIASRSFTPGADALPSAGSLAPPATPAAGPATTSATTTAAKPATTPKPATTTAAKPATTPKPAAASADDNGGDVKDPGSDSSGKGTGGDD